MAIDVNARGWSTLREPAGTVPAAEQASIRIERIPEPVNELERERLALYQEACRLWASPWMFRRS
jgi:hypothetical protein